MLLYLNLGWEGVGHQSKQRALNPRVEKGIETYTRLSSKTD